jgi:hypothetical protein
MSILSSDVLPKDSQSSCHSSLAKQTADPFKRGTVFHVLVVTALPNSGTRRGKIAVLHHVN